MSESTQVEGEDRYAELKRLLQERRQEILAQVQIKMRDVRESGASQLKRVTAAADDSSESDVQDDIEITLIQMKSETLHKIVDAERRLELGQYGFCFDCGDPISARRLRALPFAVRCTDCEQGREVAERQERIRNMRKTRKIRAK